MNILRHIGLFLAGSLLSFCLFTVVILTGFLQLVSHPQKIKDIAKQSGIYQTVVGGILDQAKKQQTKEANEDDIPLDRPEIKQAAEKAFNPEFLQSSTENVIDGTYRWLNGDVAKPDFKIDLTTVKQSFIDNIAQYAKDRTADLPTCKKNEIPNDVDLFNATCIPPGFDVDAAIADQKAKLSSGEFLSDTVITADNIGNKEDDKMGNKTTTSDFTDKYKVIPKAYQKLKLAPLILGGLAVFAALIIILISSTRRKGVRRVAITLIVAGVIILLGILIINLGLDKARNAALDNESAAAFKDNLLRALDLVGQAIKQPYLLFGGLYAGVGIATLLALKLFWPTQAKAKVASHHEHETSVPESATDTVAETDKPEKTEPTEPEHKPKS